jgi:aromatic ring-opening dioxygenase LigB subunit
MSSGVLMSAIFPHAPILVGAMGGEWVREVAPLVSAIGGLVQQIVRVNPETVILATPHAPLALDAFGIHVGDVLRGSFAHYGRSALSVCFENDLELVDEIISQVLEHRMKSFEIPEGTPLDHGALVPLYFLWETGWRGRVVVLSTSYLSERDHVCYGQCVERAAHALSRRAVFIGSANLSHRLSDAAPYGYHPRACEFDREIVSAVEHGDFARLVRIAPELRDLAIECGHRPILVAVGVAGATPRHPRVLSYASVLGVGYMVAILADRTQEESTLS